MKPRKLIARGLALGCMAFTGPPAPPAAADPAFSWTSPASADHHAPYADYRPLADVSCPTESLCVAVAPSRNGEGGNVVTSTAPTGGSALNWTLAAVNGNNF